MHYSITNYKLALRQHRGYYNDWIDVNDQLPPTGIDSVYGSAWVLISYLFDGKQYEGEGRYIKTDKNPYWKNVHGDKMINNEVTHWMYMPDSPKLKEV